MPPRSPAAHRMRPAQGSATSPAAAYPEPMTSASAHELPADDPKAFAEAVDRAAAGERVRLVARDGRRVADVVPPAPDSDIERSKQAAARFFAATGGTPSLEHYRQVYAAAGVQWPGDDAARQLFPVADAS